MKSEIVTDFLVQKIFIYHEVYKKLLSDNSTNLLANIIKYYL